MLRENKILSKFYAPVFHENCIVSRGVEIKELLDVRKEAIAYFQPCVSEKGKLMADIELKDEAGKILAIDPEMLCSLLEIHRRRFSSLKCSRGLGVAKFTLKGREISVFQKGKLKIQRALDKEEILKVANSVARLFWGASLCKVCGQPAIYCASGRCGRCVERKSGQVIYVQDLPNHAVIAEAVDRLMKAFDIVSKMKDELVFSLERQKESAEGGAGAAEFESFIQRAQYLALYFVSEAPTKKDGVLGLLLIGVAREIADLRDTLEKMLGAARRLSFSGRYFEANRIVEGVNLIWGVFACALDALLSGNLGAVDEIKLKNDEISREVEEIKNYLGKLDEENRDLLSELSDGIVGLQKICSSLSSLV
jgi:hypothetical protein